VAKMVTLLFTSFLILALLSLAAYFWQKSATATKTESLPSLPGRALFEEGTPSGIALAAAEDEANEIARARQRRDNLIARAHQGDKTALQEVKDEIDLYDEVLNALTSRADSEKALLSLASFVTRNELRVNRNLAEKFIDSGRIDQGTVAKVLHIAALSNDAGVYQRAVQAALASWRDGALSGVSATELQAILEGEFWILSSATRSSGAGFLLKRELASARRELDAAHHE
jgi:hypothetical protein